jgi:hypothetical protein
MASRKKHRPGPGGPSGRVVEAQQVIVRDRAGNVRAQLGCAADGGPQLRLMGADGRRRLVAGVCDGVPAVSLFDEAGRPRAALTFCGEGGVVALHLLDPDGVLRVALGFGQDTGVLQLRDAHGRLRLVAGSTGGGDSLVQFTGEDDGVGVGLGYLGGAGSLALSEGTGERRVESHVTASGTHRSKAGGNGAGPQREGGAAPGSPDTGPEGHRRSGPNGPGPRQN